VAYFLLPYRGSLFSGDALMLNMRSRAASAGWSRCVELFARWSRSKEMSNAD